jgi:hypothetical protein
MNITVVYCAIVVGLVASYLAVALCHGKVSYFASTLPRDIIPTYCSIRKYRTAYLLLGIVIATIITMIYNYHSMNEHKGWISAILFLVIPIIVYMIIPKSTYLLLESVNCKAWFQVYLCMKNAMIYGFLLVFLVILLIGWIINSVSAT